MTRPGAISFIRMALTILLGATRNIFLTNLVTIYYRDSITNINIIKINTSILKTRERLNQILAENTGKPLDVIAADTERDNYMTALEAKEYGLIDEIVTNRK